MKIKNIIFDFDGVLIRNSEKLLETHRNTLGWISDEEHLQVFDGNTPEFLKQYTQEEMDWFWEKWKKVLLNEKIERGARNFLEENKEKKLFIISSNSEEILNKILKNSSLENIFKRVLGKETHPSKIEKFLILQKEEKIRLEESIFITDSLGDLREASHFPELKTVAVTFGVHNKERLKKGKPNFIIDEWDALDKLRIL